MRAYESTWRLKKGACSTVCKHMNAPQTLHKNKGGNVGCAHTRMHICRRKCACTCTQAHTCKYACVQGHMCILAQMPMHTRMHTPTHSILMCTPSSPPFSCNRKKGNLCMIRPPCKEGDGPCKIVPRGPHPSQLLTAVHEVPHVAVGSYACRIAVQTVFCVYSHDVKC